ncbi:MAG: hypothetical protein IH822_08090 [Chloroflexi bacterium]|nr:hypothetical protein [Chloroflexota bacterium]
MRFISRIWGKVKRSPAAKFAAFPIAGRRVTGGKTSRDFEPDNSYLEVRISEQFLRDKRTYWRDWNPLTVAATELIYDGKRSSFPFVVGPDLLSEVPELQRGDSVSYRNTRILGPTPYHGDDVSLFVGLFRLKTGDWAEKALSLLELVAKAVDTTKLSSYVNIADPLMDGIESFLGMKEVEFRLGQRWTLADAEAVGSDVLTPGYFVIIGRKSTEVKSSQFWVKDGQLLHGANKSVSKPYMEDDYVLYEISCRGKRNDHVTFEFEKRWREVRSLIWKGEEGAARRQYSQVLALLGESADFTPRHRGELALLYKAKLEYESAHYKDGRDPQVSVPEIVDSSYAASAERAGHIQGNEDAVRVMNLSRRLYDDLVEQGPETLVAADSQESDFHKALDVVWRSESDFGLIHPDKVVDALRDDAAGQLLDLPRLS